jgi:hypothetical protein
MTPKLLAAAAATLLCAIPAFAQTSPPVDPSSKTQAKSPTTKGRGLGDQPADPTAGQKPATDPQSKKQSESPTTNGAGSGEQGSDATPGQKPATDIESKTQNDHPASR